MLCDCVTVIDVIFMYNVTLLTLILSLDKKDK